MVAAVSAGVISAGTAAALGAGALGAAGSIASGAMQSGAAGSAARKQQQATLAGWNMARPLYDAARAQQEPWNQAGQDALWRLQDLLGFKGNNNPSSGYWLKPITMRQGAEEAGVDYDRIAREITPEDIRALIGITPQQAFAPITGQDIKDFSGLDMQSILGSAGRPGQFSLKDILGAATTGSNARWDQQGR